MDIFYIFTFDSTQQAMRCEKELKEEGFTVRIIPTPREITASCGLSLRFEKKDQGIIQDKVREQGLEIMGIYRVEKEGLKKQVFPVNEE
jgi:hypothetical protein